MAHEFDFLRSRWPRLAALGNDAARLAQSSPSSSVRTLNRFCEMAAIMAMEQLKITSIPDDTQDDRIDALKTSGVPFEILAKFHNVKVAMETQTPLGRADQAAACIQDCQDIGRWLLRQADGGIYVPQGGFSAPQAQAAPRPAAKPAAPQETPDAYVPNRVELYPQERESAPIRRNQNYEESRPVPGSGIEAGVKGFLSQFGKVNWIIVAAIALVVVIIIALLALLSRNDPGKSTLPTATPTPPGYTVPVATLIPTPSPTPDPATFVVYAEDLEYEAVPADYNTVFTGRWTANDHNANFRIGDTGYDHGLGMFIGSRKITGAHQSYSLMFNLEGKYSEMIFDLGADPDWSYGEASEEYGTFRILVSLDDAADPAYDSQANPGSFIERDIHIDLTGVETLRIKLVQSKGRQGTLSVVLGDLRFILTEDAWQEQNAPAQTPAPVDTPAPAETPAA